MIEYFNIQSVNTYINPLESDGQLIHALNVTSFPLGGLSKRGGYGTFLGTVSGQVNALFSFPFQNGTQLYLYAASGSVLNFSTQGTSGWQQANPGTINNNAYVGHAVFGGTLCIGDGNTNLWTSSNGTSFTQPGSAPIVQYLVPFHNRLYTSDGTSNTIQYSTANDPTNWQNSGTSDSSFFYVLGPGAVQKLFTAGDMLQIMKSRGNMFTWDDTTLSDKTTIYGPTAARSVAQIDNYWFYANQYGIFGDDGVNKQVLSNPVQRQFYNKNGQGISGSYFGQSGSAIATTYIWDYLVTIGSVTDDFTGQQITNALLKYDYQKNTFVNWQFNDYPTAFHSYLDINNKPQLIFGDNNGNIYQYDMTKTSDNGNPIHTEMLFLFTYASQSSKFSPDSAQTIFGSTYQKLWKWIRLFFNPGDECGVQFAFSDSLAPHTLKWSEIINIKANQFADYWQESDGVVEIRLPRTEGNDPRSRFMFLRIFDYSTTSQFSYYGCQIEADVIVK